jgi:hypothetical protein
VNTLDYDDLLKLHNDLAAEIEAEKVKLDNAKRAARSRARWADPNPSQRIEERIADLGRRKLRVQTAMSAAKERKRAEDIARQKREQEELDRKRSAGLSLEFYFWRVCLRRLYRAEFESLVEEAKGLMANEQREHPADPF